VKVVSQAIGVIQTLFFLVSCETPQEVAQRELREELEARERAQAGSMRLYREGLSAYQAGRLEEAAGSFREAVQSDARNVVAWMYLGAAEEKQGRHLEAAEAFEKSSSLLPDRYEPLFNLGSVLESVGKYREAIVEYKKALELSPDGLEVMENLARSYLRLGENLEEAKRLIDRALAAEHRPEWREWLGEQQAKLEKETRDERGH